MEEFHITHLNVVTRFKGQLEPHCLDFVYFFLYQRLKTLFVTSYKDDIYPENVKNPTWLDDTFHGMNYKFYSRLQKII